MSSPQPSPQLSLREVIAIPGFRQLWLSQLVSIFGDFLALYAVIAMVSFRLRGTPAQVTLVSVAFILPLAIIGPLAGAFVDRWDPRRTMIVSDLARGVLILGLMWAQAPWQIYLVLFSASVFSSFFVPAQSVVIPQLVPLEGLMSANAAMQQAMQMVRILSPALSVAMVGWLGYSSCYAIDSISFLLSAAIIARIAVPPRPPHPTHEMKSILSDMISGMRFILTHPVISFVILSIAAGMFALGAFGSLTAVYVRDILHGPQELFGTLGSMIGLGMLAGSFVVVRFSPRFPNKMALISTGMLACGVNIAIIAWAGITSVTIAGCIGIGLSASLLMIPSMAVMQGQVPAEMRGRVSSSAMSLMTMAQGVALLFAGDMASRFGIVNVYYASAAMLAGIAGFGFVRGRRRP